MSYLLGPRDVLLVGIAMVGAVTAAVGAWMIAPVQEQVSDA